MKAFTEFIPNSKATPEIMKIIPGAAEKAIIAIIASHSAVSSRLIGQSIEQFSKAGNRKDVQGYEAQVFRCNRHSDWF